MRSNAKRWSLGRPLNGSPLLLNPARRQDAEPLSPGTPALKALALKLLHYLIGNVRIEEDPLNIIQALQPVEQTERLQGTLFI